MISTQTRTARITLRQDTLTPEALLFFKVPKPIEKTLRREQSPPPVRVLSDENFVEVHRQRLHPLVAAAKLDLHPDTVVKRQRKLNLEPHLYNGRSASGKKRLPDEQFKLAHKSRLSTGEAAVRLLVRPSTVLSRWKKLDLEPKKDRRVKVTDEQLIGAHAKKLSSVEAAAKLGVDPSTISRGWKFLDLVAPGMKKRVTDQQLAEAFEKGLDSEQARKKLKVSRSLVCRRWKELGLVPKGSPNYQVPNAAQK